MRREYVVSCDGRPTDRMSNNGLGAVHIEIVCDYIDINLPGYKLIAVRYVKTEESEELGLYKLWRAEAINHKGQMGVVIWIKELM